VLTVEKLNETEARLEHTEITKTTYKRNQHIKIVGSLSDKAA
jgi:hypothetical protein